MSADFDAPELLDVQDGQVWAAEYTKRHAGSEHLAEWFDNAFIAGARVVSHPTSIAEFQENLEIGRKRREMLESQRIAVESRRRQEVQSEPSEDVLAADQTEAEKLDKEMQAADIQKNIDKDEEEDRLMREKEDAAAPPAPPAQQGTIDSKGLGDL